MASSQSTGGKYANINFFKQENFPLLTKQVLLKQQNVDTAEAHLRELNRVLGTRLSAAKDQDKQYIAHRVTQSRNIINRALRNGLDLSNENNLMHLEQQYKQVVDQKVLNAVTATYTRQAEIQHINELKEKNPEKFDPRNYAAYNRKWQKYMADDRTGVAYGGSSYQPFVDIKKRFLDKDFYVTLEKMGVKQEYIKRIAIAGNPIDAIATMKGIPQNQINRLRRVIDATIGRDGQRQMIINSRAQYGYGDDVKQVLKHEQDIKDYYTDQIKVKEDYIEAAKTELKTKTNPKDKEALQEKIEASQTYLEELKDSKNNLKNLVVDGVVNKDLYQNESAKAYMSSYKQGIFGMVYEPPVMTDLDVDKVAKANAEYKLKVAKFNEVLRDKAAKEARDKNNNLPGLSDVRISFDSDKTNAENLIANIAQEKESTRKDVMDYLRNNKLIGKEKKLTEQDWFDIQQQLKKGGFEKDSITIGEGDNKEVIDLTDELRGKLQALEKPFKDYNSLVATTDELVGDRANAMYQGFVDKEKAQEMLEDGGWWVDKSTKTANFKIVSTANGGVKLTRWGYGQKNGSNLRYLLEKVAKGGEESLSDNEKLTLRLYSTIALQATSKLSDFQNDRNIKLFEKRIASKNRGRGINLDFLYFNGKTKRRYFDTGFRPTIQKYISPNKEFVSEDAYFENLDDLAQIALGDDYGNLKDVQETINNEALKAWQVNSGRALSAPVTDDKGDKTDFIKNLEASQNIALDHTVERVSLEPTIVSDANGDLKQKFVLLYSDTHKTEAGDENPNETTWEVYKDKNGNPLYITRDHLQKVLKESGSEKVLPQAVQYTYSSHQQNPPEIKLGHSVWISGATGDANNIGYTEDVKDNLKETRDLGGDLTKSVYKQLIGGKIEFYYTAPKNGEFSLKASYTDLDGEKQDITIAGGFGLKRAKFTAEEFNEYLINRAKNYGVTKPTSREGARAIINHASEMMLAQIQHQEGNTEEGTKTLLK